MGLHNQRQQESQFLLLMENRCSVRVNLQVGMVPHKRVYDTHGMSDVIKDG